MDTTATMHIDDQLLKDLVKQASDFLLEQYTTTSRSIRAPEPARIHAISHLPTQLPSSPSPPEDVLTSIINDLAPGLYKQSSPHFYGFVTGGITPAALIADILVTALDQAVTVHLPGDTIGTTIERCAFGMLCDLFALPRNDWAAGGIFTTGATSGNILGIACGREWLLRDNQGKSVSHKGYLTAALDLNITGGIKILTACPHSSIAKAASIVGLGTNCVVNIGNPSQPWNFDLDALEDILQRQATDKTRYIVVPTFGEVNTGKFTANIPHIRALCTKYNAWLHIDAAFGIFARCFTSIDNNDTTPSSITTAHPPNSNTIIDTNQLTAWSHGLEMADSIAGDAHKLLNVPYDCGFFLIPNHRTPLLTTVCSNPGAAYYSASSDGVPFPCNTGIENSRRFRALPVYATLVTYGRTGYEDMIQRLIIHTRQIAAYIKASTYYELCINDEEPEFTVVLFRAKDDALNEVLEEAVNDSGKMWLSGTRWMGEKAMRIAVANWKVGVGEGQKEKYGSWVAIDVLEEIAKKFNSTKA